MTDACRIEQPANGKLTASDHPLLAQVQAFRDESQAQAAAKQEFPTDQNLQRLAVQSSMADGSTDHPKLGCWDQLTLDAARIYPNDKTLQRAAAEEAMGPMNFSSEQEKLMAAYREFPQGSKLQDLAVKDAEFKYFKQGSALPASDQALLDNTRHDRDTAKETNDAIQHYMPFARQEFPDDLKLQTLEAKNLAQHSLGRVLLSDSDYARLTAGKEFPKDKQLQDLAAKEFLAQHPGNPQLTSSEKAKLTAERYGREAEQQFPHDKELQRLAIKSEVASIPGQPQLTPQERAHLAAARAFPDDAAMQKLYVAKALEHQPGNSPLSAQQEMALAKGQAAREFPHDQRLQNIAVKEQLWLSHVKGYAGLSREDYMKLENARQERLIRMLLPD